MGFFDIPTVQRKPTGWLALVLCILLSGIGTIIVGVMEKQKNVWILGIIQLVLTPVFGIGAIWAIVWGIIVFVRSDKGTIAFTEVPAAKPAAAPAASAPAKKAPAKKAAAKKAPAKKAAAKKAK